VLQVHDELVYEVPSSHARAAAVIVKECMEGAVDLGDVSLQVKVSVGQSWGQLEEVTATQMGEWEEEVMRGYDLAGHNVARDIFGREGDEAALQGYSRNNVSDE